MYVHMYVCLFLFFIFFGIIYIRDLTVFPCNVASVVYINIALFNAERSPIKARSCFLFELSLLLTFFML
jgi:hypothetical protein